ncbi:release factor glutamine methyltransferase-like [Oculina patagonica]
MSTVTEVEGNRWAVDEMLSLATNKPRTKIMGKEFLVHPGVFHPDAWSDAIEVMNKEFLKELKGDLTKKVEEDSFDFLEVGCGAGYTAILAALTSPKCHVLATDINETAVENAIENAKLHGVDNRVKVVVSDVFNHEIFTGKKFDMIYWDPPWAGQHTEPGTNLDLLMRSLLDPGYQSFRRYLLEAKNYLKKTGRIFAAFSFNIGSKELFDRVVKETGWNYKILSTKNILFEIAGDQQEVNVYIVEFLKQE